MEILSSCQAALMEALQEKAVEARDTGRKNLALLDCKQDIPGKAGIRKRLVPDRPALPYGMLRDNKKIVCIGAEFEQGIKITG